MNVFKRISLATRIIFQGQSALKTFDPNAINHDVEELRVKDIVDATASVYGVRAIDILGRRRKKEFSEARHAAMLVALKCTRWGYADIGRFFNRDHTTVMYAEKKIGSLENSGLRLRIELIKRKAKVA